MSEVKPRKRNLRRHIEEDTAVRAVSPPLMYLLKVHPRHLPLMHQRRCFIFALPLRKMLKIERIRNMKGICAYLGFVCVGMVMLSFNAVGGVFTPLKSTDQSFVEQKSTNSLISMTTEQLSKILARKNSMTKNFNGYTNGIKMTSMKFSSEKHARQYIDSVDVGDFYYMPSGVRNLKRSRSRVLLRSAEKVVGTQIPEELSKNSVARLVEHNLLQSTNSITKWSIGQIVNADAIVVKDRSDNTKNDNSGQLAKFSTKETIVKELSECRLKLADFNIKVDPVFVDAKSGMMCTVEYELVICLANGVDTKKFFGADWEDVSPMPGTSDQFVLSLNVETAEDVFLQAREYSKKDGVVWAEPNMSREYIKNNVLNDTYWSDLWHLKNSPSKGSVNAQDAWDTATGENVVIAVVDDGVEIAHEDLAANIYSNDGEIAGNGIDDDGNGYIDDVNGWNFVDNTKNANPIDADDVHGTSVAGMAAAVGNNGKGVAGAAYKAKILPVKISKGSTWATDAAIASAIRYAAGLTGDGWRGADVINCSWGGGDASSVQISAFSDAASRGRNGKGCPIFCASGNSAASWWITGISGIPAGDYEFKWTYTKDGSGSVGYDCAWISCVMIGNTILSGSDFVTAGNEPWTICNGPDGLVLGNGAVVPTFKSGDVGDYESSILRCAVRFNGGSITYMYRVDAEIALDNLGNFYAYDGLSFSINGNTQISQVEHAFDYILNAGMVSFNCSNPAAYSSTIAVGASTSYDFRSPYSQFGASLDFVAPSDGDGFVDDFFGVFTAPMSTDRTGSYGYASGNYTTFGGTSSASPLATGVGALVLSKNPTLTAEEVRTILRKSCDKIGEYSYSGGISGAGGRNDVYGYGRINAKKALEITPASSSSQPPAAPVISSVTTTDSSCAKITWNTVAGATRYDLYRNTSSSRPSSAYKTNVTSPYSDTGATPGTTYYYWVAAVNSAGTSYSSVASGKRAESLTVSSSSITAEASGKSGTISVTAHCGWTASKSVSWITVSPASGTGNGSISYTISANTTSSSRSGTITVRSSGGISRTISVSQDSASLPDLVIDAWDEWSHGYGIFTTGYPVTDIETCQPNFLFNKGTQFSLAYGIWNYGEGAVDSTIGMQLTFQRENPVHDESWLWDFTEEASWETGYGMVDAGYSTAWCDLPAGVYLASLLVDSDNDVEETDEDNNYFSVPFAIYDPIPLSEALGNAELTFNTSNNAWYGTRGDGPDGVTARTKHLGNNASNILSAEVSGAGTISFKWRVSSEEEYDVLDFIVDGEIIESISGNGDGWQDVTYEIETDGKHRLEWRYAKDDSYFSGFDCAWLSNMDWEPAGPQWTIENGVLTSVDLKGEKNVIIPNGVWKIGYYAFGGDYSVQSVTIPNTVTHIDGAAFSGCWNLSSVVIPDSVVSIGDYAFCDCRITQITIPKNVSEIGAGAFSMCPISAFAVSPENKNFKAVSGLLLSKDGTRLVAVPDKMKNLVVPSGVTTIAEGAAYFASCTNAVLPSSLALIDYEAFSCAGLKTISIPSSVKIVADYAFAYCIDMAQVTLAEGVTSIGEYAFGEIGAKSIRIPMSVKDIGGGAFAYCENLTEATVPYLLKNMIENDDWPVFEECPSSLKITYYTVVTFNANGGTGSATRTVIYGAGVGTLPVPTRSGYDFLGWFTAANGGTKISATTKVTSNVTYYAHWIQRCTITFNANSGTGGTTRTVANGAAVGTLPTPTRTGYNFLGWFTAINGGTKISATTKVTSNVTYYAHWEIKRYTITFNANGGTGGTTRTVSHGSKIGTLPVPARNGYAFLGWYSYSNGGNKISSATVVTSSSTYYAQWEPYRLTSDVNGLAPEDSASVYDGYLYMVDEFVGTIQVKVSKPKKGIANVMASIQIAGAKKVNLKGKMDVIEGFFEAETKDGRWLWLEFGVNGLIGNFDGYDIDGVRNLFSSKDKSDKEIVQSAVAQWVGTMNMIWGDGILSISIAKSGKVTIKGNVTVDSKEEKVSLTTQALIGENHLCIPVLYSKKSIVLTFVVWLPLEGGEVEIVGISDAFIGGAGNLKAIASFKIDDDASFWKLLPGRILKECLPNNLAIINNGKKWVLPKAGKVVYLKGTNEIDWSKAKENPSGLKLSYKSKDGSFSGSFKVYSEVNGKPKPTSVSVKGVLINGVGYGIATIKKVGSIDIVIE